MVGTLGNPRRMVPQIVKALKNVEGIKLELYPTMSPRNQKELDELGGDLSLIKGGNKTWVGLPNIYNRLDVLIRCDSDPGYSFPVLEAAACGVPVIATDSGIDHLITKVGGGFLIEGDREYYQHHEDQVMDELVYLVKFLRDNPKTRKKMSALGKYEVKKNWQWDKFIPDWRKFFREGVEKAAYYTLTSSTSN
jgi:glycosyltransferase involved in cell wall biosynthesis